MWSQHKGGFLKRVKPPKSTGQGDGGVEAESKLIQLPQANGRTPRKFRPARLDPRPESRFGSYPELGDDHLDGGASTMQLDAVSPHGHRRKIGKPLVLGKPKRGA